MPNSAGEFHLAGILRGVMMSFRATTIGEAAPLASWPDMLQQAASEVFSMMAAMDAVSLAATRSQAQQNESAPTITGTVGIAGALSAIFSLRCSAECAARIASGMLGIPVTDASPHRCDAVGEICNIIAGQFKAKIGLEDKCMLSVPTVISGGNYRLHATSATRRVEVSLLCDGEPVRIALEVRSRT